MKKGGRENGGGSSERGEGSEKEEEINDEGREGGSLDMNKFPTHIHTRTYLGVRLSDVTEQLH